MALLRVLALEADGRLGDPPPRCIQESLVVVRDTDETPTKGPPDSALLLYM